MNEKRRKENEKGKRQSENKKSIFKVIFGDLREEEK